MGRQTFSVETLITRFIPINYFVILYSTLYILSPYINILIKNLNNENFRKLIIFSFILFSVWNILTDFYESMVGQNTMGLSTIGMYGSQYGYTIVNFMLIYLIGAYLRINNIILSKRKVITGIVVCFIILYISSVAELLIGLKTTTTWNYDNPIIILISALLLILFVSYKFENKFINEISKATFTCFLLHGIFLNYLHIEMFVNKSLPILILHQFGSAIIIYLISYVVYKIYYLCTHWFINFINQTIDKINISVQQ